MSPWFDTYQHRLHLPLFAMHADGFTARDFVIVTEEMQDTVDQESLQFFLQRVSLPLRLARGRLDGDDYVSQ